MTSAGDSLGTPTIISALLEGIVYGFSVLMFIGTIWASTYKHRTRDVNRSVTVVAVLLFILSTAHMVVNAIHTEDGLVRYRDTFPAGPAASFADVLRTTFVIKNLIYYLQTLLGDAVAIYRCYVVWQTIWVIILPSMLWCGVAITGAHLINIFPQATSNAGEFFTEPSKLPIWAFYALTLATNLLSSGFLAYRIWKIERNVSAIRTTKITTTSILRIIMDAAILYSIVLLIALVGCLRSNNGSSVVIDMLTPIISIAFYMVIIRIEIGKHTHNQLSTVRGGMVNETKRGNLPQYPMKPLQVHVS
ncbi:hypothetical protein DFH29DRAFT_137578 [Suillus ampliporus]|nr:hypothetical protein DFH29DRAFT_137578 [Suillus ampliporus]